MAGTTVKNIIHVVAIAFALLPTYLFYKNGGGFWGATGAFLFAVIVGGLNAANLQKDTEAKIDFIPKAVEFVLWAVPVVVSFAWILDTVLSK